jgi:cob(I)alamin adenosyltransferase
MDALSQIEQQLAALAQTLATEVMRQARDEHEDMRDTVQRLEALVTDLQQRLRKLEESWIR